jgi:glycosyltransferase involved in cell wall biosynthesis
MQNQIAKIIYDDTLRNKLIENGKIRRKDFSWAKTANETKNFYMHSL